MESATEAELGGLFENCRKATSMLTALAEMGHSKPPTPVAMENTAAKIIVNRTSKQKGSRSIYMRFDWVRDRIRQNNFHIFWEKEAKNLADCVIKHCPIWYRRTIIPRY